MKRLPAPGDVREIRLRLLCDGKPIPGLISLDVTQNSHYQADRFRLEIALNAEGGKDLDWWGADERKGVLFDVRAIINGKEVSFIIGEAEQVDIQPETGTVQIEGRDLSSRLIDNKLQEAFKNRTSSEIAKELAARRGLTPVVNDTATLVERYYQADHDHISNDQFSKTSTEWDLLSFLAQQEGFDLFVKGVELHFQKTIDPAHAEPWNVSWDQLNRRGDVTNLKLGRSLTLAKDVVVLVRSWHSAKGKGFTRGSPRGAATNAVNAGKAQRYVITRPNLTEDQAQKLADSIRADITKHERTISFDCPGELEMSPRDIIAVTGIGGWSQRYFVDTITRRIEIDRGFTMSVRAKNHWTESQTSLG